MSFKDEVGELSERGSLRLVSCLGLYLDLRAEHLEAKLFQGRVEVLFRRLARCDLLVSELCLCLANCLLVSKISNSPHTRIV